MDQIGQVWTSARRRAYHTAWPFVRLDYKVEEKPQMSEINPGVWDGLSSDEAKEKYPDEWERFLKDPYAHRAPRAESYHDLSGTYFASTSAAGTAELDGPLDSF
jgi:6-phosphofructo-2-kinase/fructose-2,6-biphosphatase 4